ncbi:MAG: hypothetical protein WKF77_09425 [Planctomycetaceae bacterium]
MIAIVARVSDAGPTIGRKPSFYQRKVGRSQSPVGGATGVPYIRRSADELGDLRFQHSGESSSRKADDIT